MNYSKEQLMSEIQKVGFAATDMHLYLDTHPTDRNAIMIYNKYAMHSKMLNDIYEKNFGMINFDSPSYKYPFNWVVAPWPWMPVGMRSEYYDEEE
jgi:spore coat protein JB